MFDEAEMIRRIKESVRKADKVLVGIGTELQVACEEGAPLSEFANAVRFRRHILDMDRPLRQDQAYRHLKQLLEGKDAYIISLAMDDAVYRIFQPEDRIVCPCGGFRYLQCPDGCSSDLVPYDGGDSDSCPHCGAKLTFNNLLAGHYVEEGYLPKFADYKKWLQTTVNRKLCIIELGAGMEYPSVIRFPFDKTAYFNQKCEFYRVHETLYQHTAENHDRGTSVPVNALAFMENEGWASTC